MTVLYTLLTFCLWAFVGQDAGHLFSMTKVVTEVNRGTECQERLIVGNCMDFWR